MEHNILVTGGAGFIGSAVVRHLVGMDDYLVVNVDKLTYAGNLDSLLPVKNNPRYVFEKADICDRAALERIFLKYKPMAVMHLAAESYVDRSIDGPLEFINTNIVGTFNLLEAARTYCATLNNSEQKDFRFHHVSTDEVYGDLHGTSEYFRESTAYQPSSPYSASKASSDHLVRAWGRTYGLPVIVTNCSNNYGPYQFPEKLIPHMILNAVSGRHLPVYGDGMQVRDWLFVEDHARILCEVFRRGKIGETYNIGGGNEKRNIDVVHLICEILEQLVPERKPNGITRYLDLICFVKDRPGHDKRYAIDAKKIKVELGLESNETFETGLRKTVIWYLENDWWWRPLLHR